MAYEVTLGGDGALFVGEDKTLRMQVLDEDGDPVTISGWAISMVIRRTDDPSDTAVLTKTATISGNLAVVTLTDTEMAITAGYYRHSWKRTDDGSETVLAYGPFIVEAATQN